MSRLTYELGHKGSGSYEPIQHKAMPANNYIRCINKLGKLEDLEEEIGCSLEVIFKAIKNGIYYKNNARKTIYIKVYFTTNSYKTEFVLRDLNDDYALLSRNYKKTWWLKEDRSE